MEAVRGEVRRLAGGLLLAACVFLALPLSAHEGGPGSPLGFDERLGSVVDLAATFRDEGGASLSLGDFAGRPVILLLGYYRCKDLCNTLFVGTATAFRDLKGLPGKDWQAISVSINPTEGPEDAREKKRLSLAVVGSAFPPEGWRFLVGGQDMIDRLTESVGFEYRRVGEDFDHPLGLVVLSPEGKIVRYILGPDILPVDLSMAVMEASSGLVRPTVAKLLRLCLSYDPNKKQFGFDFLRVTGIATTILVIGLAIVLAVSGGRRRRARIGTTGGDAAAPGDGDKKGRA